VRVRAKVRAKVRVRVRDRVRSEGGDCRCGDADGEAGDRVLQH